MAIHAFRSHGLLHFFRNDGEPRPFPPTFDFPPHLFSRPQQHQSAPPLARRLQYFRQLPITRPALCGAKKWLNLSSKTSD